jgi:hypothetical protein
MRKMTVAAAIMVQAVVLLPASAQTPDGAYRGTLNCAKLSWTKGPLTNEPVSVAIANGKITYSRTLYGADRSMVIGQESGTGTLGRDGVIELSGGSNGGLGNLKATYRGKVVDGAVTMIGSQEVSYQGNTEIRACTLQLKF